MQSMTEKVSYMFDVYIIYIFYSKKLYILDRPYHITIMFETNYSVAFITKGDHIELQGQWGIMSFCHYKGEYIIHPY